MKDYLSEAFKKLNLLNEDTFSLTPDGVEELKDFMNNDVDNTDISVIDMEAETQEELKDSYIGKFILDCEVCHSKIFIDQEEIKVDEDSDLVNMDMECPYCHCQDGYTIIGKVCDAHCEDGECEEKEIEVEDEEDVEEGLLSGDNNISIGNNNSSNLDLGDVAGAAASLAPMLLASDAGEKKSLKNRRLKEELFHNSNGTDYEVLARNKVGDALLKSTSPEFTQYVVAWNCPVEKGSWGQGHYFRDGESAKEFWDKNYANLTEALTEDTVKNRKGKWVNKGKEGTHGEFRTKKAADAQRKAMFAQGYKADESLNESAVYLSSAVDLYFDDEETKNKAIENLKNSSNFTIDKIGDDYITVISRGWSPEVNKALSKELGLDESLDEGIFDKKNLKDKTFLLVKSSPNSKWSVVAYSDDTDKLAEYETKLENSKYFNDKDYKPEFQTAAYTAAKKYSNFDNAKNLDESLKEEWEDLDEYTYNDIVSELVKKINEKFPEANVTVDDIEFDDSRSWSLFIRGSKLGLSVNKFGAYRNYLGGGIRGPIENNGRAEEGTEELGELFADKLSTIEEVINMGHEDEEEWDKPTGVLESVNEDFKEVKIKTDDTEMEMTSDENGKVTVTTEPIKNEECETCENSEEVIAPLSDEEKGEIEVKAEENGEEEVKSEEEIDDFDEESFDELGESYLKEVYDNVDSYKTTKAYMKNKKLFVEGNINFKSGKTKTTQFIFESKNVNDKMRLIGENANITRGKKAFKVTGKVVNNKFLSESFNYNYSTKDSNGKSIRLYNTIKRNK